jgi:hypothetical protein
MQFGPCGGVRSDLSGEMASIPCPFAAGGPAAVVWSGPPAPVGARIGLLEAAATRPVVLTDFTVVPFSAGSVAAVSRVLAGSCEVCSWASTTTGRTFPPTLMVGLIRDVGGSPWITLTLPGLHLDREQVTAVLNAADPATTGIASAVAEARALLAVEGVVG